MSAPADILERIRAYFRVAHAGHEARVHAALAQPQGAAGDSALMACTAASFTPTYAAGVMFRLVSSISPLEAILENLDTNARGFDASAPASTLAEAEAFRADLVAGRCVTALFEGLAVAGGMLVAPLDGVGNLAGIATLPAYRQRGFGAALTSELVRVAFGLGVDLVFLDTDNPNAYRVYQRVGFLPVGSLTSLGEPHDTQS